MRLDVFDTADAAHPRRRGSLELPYSVDGLAAAGPFAYLAVGHFTPPPGGGGDEVAGLLVVDARDPDAPRVAALLPTASIPNPLAVSGDHVFLGLDGLSVVDVADPTAPRVVGSLPGVGVVRELAVHGPTALLAADEVVRVDISTPEQPTEVGRLPLGFTDAVALDDAFAYVARGEDVTAFRLAVSWPTPAEGALRLADFVADMGVLPGTGLLAVADGWAGVYTLRVSPPVEARLWLPIAGGGHPPTGR
jgi:hypothetical protein